MANLNQIELQELRHLIGAELSTSKQMNAFAQQCTDPQLKNHLQSSAGKAEQNCKTLLGFLQ